MTFAQWVAAAWIGTLLALAVLLVYRAVLALKEDDQIFLDPAESAFEREHAEVLGKLTRLGPYIRGVSKASAALFAVMAGLGLHQAFR